MLFNSLEFLLFLPMVVLLYYLTPHKFRWVLLLAASYFFYMQWEATYALLILFSTVVDYGVAFFIHRNTSRFKKRLGLGISLCTNLGLLAVFKYYNFFRDELEQLLVQYDLASTFPALSLLLPVGISFYTFQTLSYTLDVYYGKQQPEKHFGIFALYVSFFPQLVAGPIERFSHLGNQLKERHALSYTNIAKGCRLILIGLFVKMGIADNVSPYVEEIYADPTGHNSVSILIGLCFYSLQIYADFYGYSIIAVGAAKLLGIDLMDNFKAPYFSHSITEFWKRWHISLTGWFRQYLYYPLGGNRVKEYRWLFNILMVFIVSGFWHGANWTFIVWGLVHGLLYLLEHYSRKIKGLDTAQWPAWLKALSTVKTFVLVTIAWVFFRSQNLNQVYDVFTSLTSNTDLVDSFHVKPQVWILVAAFIGLDYLLRNTRFDIWADEKPLVVRWSSYALLLFAVMALGGITHHPFIYFQF